MKRVLTILAILLLPLSVWAMTPVADSDLSNVTGQAGVNISLDMKMNINIGTMAWGDADGINTTFNPWTTTTSGGYVGINNFNISNLWIRGRVESSTVDSFNRYNILFLKPLTIDVGTGDKSAKGGTANTTFVRIGIGALEISMGSMSLDVALGSRAAGVDGDTAAVVSPILNQHMGTFNLGALTVYINPWSYVDIFAHDGMGVNFDVNMTIDRISMGYASWGDTDGLPLGDYTLPLNATGGPDAANIKYWMAPGYSSAGYVGLRDFNLGDFTTPAVTINGTVAIDVNTSANGTYVMLNALGKAMTSLPSSGGTYSTVSGNIADAHNGIVALGGGGEASALASIGGLTGTVSGGAWCVGFTGTQIAQYYLNTANYTTIVANAGVSYYKPISVVHISFPETAGFTINIAKMTANVAVGNTAALVSPQADIMGDIYIQGLNMNILQNSWVDIWAH